MEGLFLLDISSHDSVLGKELRVWMWLAQLSIATGSTSKAH